MLFEKRKKRQIQQKQNAGNLVLITPEPNPAALPKLDELLIRFVHFSGKKVRKVKSGYDSANNLTGNRHKTYISSDHFLFHLHIKILFFSFCPCVAHMHPTSEMKTLISIINACSLVIIYNNIKHWICGPSLSIINQEILIENTLCLNI